MGGELLGMWRGRGAGLQEGWGPAVVGSGNEQEKGAWERGDEAFSLKTACPPLVWVGAIGCWGWRGSEPAGAPASSLASSLERCPYVYFQPTKGDFMFPIF